MVSAQADAGWLTATLLTSIRVTAMSAFLPIFGATAVPGMIRVVWVVGLAATFTAALPTLNAAPIADLTSLVVAGLGEALIGAALAFGLLTAYAATQVTGRVLDIQVGFGVASILNPTTRSMSSLLGALWGICALAAFLAMDGHLVLIRALSASLSAYPPGQFGLQVDGEALLRQSSAMYAFGLALAAPVMLLLLLADIAMAVMARTLPQLNVFVLSFPIKIVLGLSGLAFSIRYANGVLQALFAHTYQYWDRISTGVNP